MLNTEEDFVLCTPYGLYSASSLLGLIWQFLKRRTQDVLDLDGWWF